MNDFFWLLSSFGRRSGEKQVPNQLPKLMMEELERRETPAVLTVQNLLSTSVLRRIESSGSSSFLGPYILPHPINDLTTAGGALFGVRGTGQTGELVRIDPNSGVTTTVVQSPLLASPMALAATSLDTLYAVSGGVYLIRIDLTTATVSRVGELLLPDGPTGSGSRLQSGFSYEGDLAVGPGGDLLYSSLRLFRVNPSTALCTAVGPVFDTAPFPFMVSGLARDGLVTYATNTNGQFGTVNTNTGTFTPISTLGFGYNGLSEDLSPVLPDVAVISAQLDSQNGATYTYRIDGSSLSTPVQIEAYWASGPSMEDRIRGPLATLTTPTTPGIYGPIAVSAAQLAMRPDGATHLLVVADRTNEVAEGDEDNNFIAVPVPDVEAVETEIVGSPGQSKQVKFTYRTSGRVESFIAGVYRSADGQFDSSDIPLYEQVVTPANPDAAEAVTFTLPSPPAFDPNHPYLLVVADVTSVIAELNEANNTAHTGIEGIDRWWATQGDGPIPVTAVLQVPSDGRWMLSVNFTPQIAGVSGWSFPSRAAVTIQGGGVTRTVLFTPSNTADLGTLTTGYYKLTVNSFAVPIVPQVTAVEFKLTSAEGTAGSRLRTLFIADRPEPNLFANGPVRVDLSQGVRGTTAVVASLDALVDLFSPTLHFDAGNGDETNGGERFQLPFDVEATWPGGRPTGSADATFPLTQFGSLTSTPSQRDLNAPRYPPKVAKPAVYAAVVERVFEGKRQLAINYFFHYPLSNWAEHGGNNTHGGDWEGITVFLTEETDGVFAPTRVAYGQHIRFDYIVIDDDGGDIVDWKDVIRTNNFSASVYIGLGGHASYPFAGITPVGVKNEYHRGMASIYSPTAEQSVYLPRVASTTAPAWLTYSGRWGQMDDGVPFLLSRGDDAPEGPAYIASGFANGLRWLDPWKWSEGFSPPASTPLTIVAVQVNGGGVQRSNVETLSVRFSREANLGVLIESGAITTAVRVRLADGSLLPLAAARFRYDPLTFTLTLDLSIDGFGGSARSLLSDGRYTLELNPAAVPGLQDTDGTADGVYRFAFHQLLGDFTGDGVVDVADRFPLTLAFGSGRGSGLYLAAYDLNDDGVVNAADYLLWTRRLYTRV